MSTFTLAVLIIGIALVFDYINGFHDAANSIATIVATRVLTPLQAVLWAAFFNFAAAFVFGTAVARTVGQGFVDLNLVTPYVIMAGLAGAIAWDLITWWLGAAHQLLARADRRVRRRGHRAGGDGAGILAQPGRAERGPGRRMAAHADVHRGGADDRDDLGVPADGGGLLALSRIQPVEDGQVFPQVPVAVGGGVQPLARLQRRAEDRRADRGGAVHVALRACVRDPHLGADAAPTRPSRWAR